MTEAHTITCAGNWCPEFAVRVSFRAISEQEQAPTHRAELASEGWTDIEGRDYCPNCAPEESRS